MGVVENIALKCIETEPGFGKFSQISHIIYEIW